MFFLLVPNNGLLGEDTLYQKVLLFHNTENLLHDRTDLLYRQKPNHL